MQALVHFPVVVDMMCQELDWTTQDGQEVLLLEPAQPEIVYVPQYDPLHTHTAPAPVATAAEPVATTATEPVASEKSGGISTTTAVVGGLLAFGGGILVANLFDNEGIISQLLLMFLL
jgi:hypothetical protein